MTMFAGHETIAQAQVGRIDLNPYGGVEPGHPWDGAERVSFPLPMCWTADELAGALYAHTASPEELDFLDTNEGAREVLTYALGSTGVRGAEDHAALWKSLPETDRTTGELDTFKATVRAVVVRMFGVVPSVNTTPAPVADPDVHVFDGWDIY